MADDGAPPPTRFPAIAARLARLIAPDPHIRLVFASARRLGHPRQPGQPSRASSPAGCSRSATGSRRWRKGSATDWNDTVVVVISEFGRTVQRKRQCAAPITATAT